MRCSGAPTKRAHRCAGAAASRRRPLWQLLIMELFLGLPNATRLTSSSGGSDSLLLRVGFVLLPAFARAHAAQSTAVGLPNSGWRVVGTAPRGFATARDDSNESRGPCVPEFPTLDPGVVDSREGPESSREGGLTNGIGPGKSPSARLGVATKQPTAPGTPQLRHPKHSCQRRPPGPHQPGI